MHIRAASLQGCKLCHHHQHRQVMHRTRKQHSPSFKFFLGGRALTHDCSRFLPPVECPRIGPLRLFLSLALHCPSLGWSSRSPPIFRFAIFASRHVYESTHRPCSFLTSFCPPVFDLRLQPQRILMHLLVALTGTNLTFATGVERTDDASSCMVSGRKTRVNRDTFKGFSFFFLLLLLLLLRLLLLLLLRIVHGTDPHADQ